MESGCVQRVLFLQVYVCDIETWCLTGVAGARCHAFRDIIGRVAEQEPLIAQSPALAVAHGTAKFARLHQLQQCVDTCLPKDLSLQYQSGKGRRQHRMLLLRAGTPLPASSGWSDEAVRGFRQSGTEFHASSSSRKEHDIHMILWEGSETARFSGPAGLCAPNSANMG